MTFFNRMGVAVANLYRVAVDCGPELADLIPNALLLLFSRRAEGRVRVMLCA
jgi:hypothetical protein